MSHCQIQNRHFFIPPCIRKPR